MAIMLVFFKVTEFVIMHLSKPAAQMLSVPVIISFLLNEEATDS